MQSGERGGFDIRFAYYLWTATGGTIDGNGLFTAAGAAGTFTVQATSAADPTAFDVATVTIPAIGPFRVEFATGPGCGVAVGPAVVQMTPTSMSGSFQNAASNLNPAGCPTFNGTFSIVRNNLVDPSTGVASWDATVTITTICVDTDTNTMSATLIGKSDTSVQGWPLQRGTSWGVPWLPFGVGGCGVGLLSFSFDVLSS